MKWPRSSADAAVLTAMLGAAAFTAQFVGGKTVRDTLYLRQLPVETLPRMIAVTSVATLVGVLVAAHAIKRVSSSRFVSGLFLLSAVLFILEWMLTFMAPRAVAIALYLHVTGLGPMLGSGFWLVVSERFDPHTAKQRFGQLAAAGTIGGLLGALLASGADRFADHGGDAAAARDVQPLVRVADPAAGHPGDGAAGRKRRHGSADAAGAALDVPRAQRGSVPAQPRGAGAARHDRRRFHRLRLQGECGDLREHDRRRSAGSVLSRSITPPSAC
jgi:hypothetical protein